LLSEHAQVLKDWMVYKCRLVGTSGWRQIQGSMQVLFLHSACTLLGPTPSPQEYETCEACKVDRAWCWRTSSVLCQC